MADDLKEGWGFPGQSRKCHYFTASTRSLCGKWGFFRGELSPDSGNVEPCPDDCRVCHKRLLARRPTETPPHD